MKYLSSSTTTLSILIAVVLFVAASLFESERTAPVPAPEAGEAATSPLGLVRADSTVRDDRAILSCRDAETRLLEEVEAAQACEVDEDCTILDYGYPIQCLTSIATSSISAVRLEYRNYEQACAYRVYYDCPSEPMQRVPVCRNSRCQVELQRNEALRQMTLDYINRQNERTP
jgi:hypothetical protein